MGARSLSLLDTRDGARALETISEVCTFCNFQFLHINPSISSYNIEDKLDLNMKLLEI